MGKNPTAEPAERERAEGSYGTGRLADQLYNQLFEQIARGNWPIGQRLPTEARLCETFRVSRPVVREALARLREDGLVVSRQGSGSYVSRSPDTRLLHFAPVGTIAETLHCFELRVGLESEAAGLAAMRRRPEDVARLWQAFEHARDLLEPPGEGGIEADLEFHLAIVETAGNAYYTTFFRSLWHQIAFGMNLARNLSIVEPRERARAIEQEHLTVFWAIRDGSPDLARATMRAHIETARRRVLGGPLASEGGAVSATCDMPSP